jgi:hypothetical protein
VAASVAPASQIVDVRVFFRTLDPAPSRRSQTPEALSMPSSGTSDPTARLDGEPSGRHTFPGDEASPVAGLPQAPADGGGWYRVRLTEEGGTWKGALPRPTSRLKRFAYYIEVFDASARVVRSEERVVRVGRKDAPCAAGEGGAAPEGEVAVQAPAVDTAAVPEGFSTKGTRSTGASQVGVTNMGSHKSLAVSLGVGAVAAGVALATYKPGEDPQSTIEVLAFEPAPGTPVSVSAPHVALRLRLTCQHDVGPGSVVVSLRPGFLACANLSVPHPGLQARTPLDVTVDHLESVWCPAPFHVQTARVEVRGPDNRAAFGREIPVQFDFVP